MQHQKILEHLGYTPKEAKVYLAALHLGEAQVTDLAKKTQLPRSTVITVVERLAKDGLLTFYCMRRHKYWVAENPKYLLRRLQEQESLVAAAIPQLTAIRASARQRIRRRCQYEELGLFRDVADSLSLPVAITDAEAHIRYVNTPWEQSFGYEYREMVGQDIGVLYGGHTPVAELQRLWQTVGLGKLFTSEQMVNRAKDGAIHSLTTVVVPVQHANRTLCIHIASSSHKKVTTPDVADLHTLKLRV